MNTKTENRVASLLILLSILGRLLPHPANITPVGAVALTGGAKLSPLWRWSVPFIALAITDSFLGWSAVSPFLYVSFAINIYFGTKIGGKHRYAKLAGFAMAGSLQFFLISNLGVWMEGLLYPKTPAGLMACYTAAIPFLKNSLLGDLGWSLALFTVIERAQLWVLAKRKPQTA